MIMLTGRLVSTKSLYWLFFIVSWQQAITGSFLSTGIHFDVNLPGFEDVTDVAVKRELEFHCQPFKKIGCFDNRKPPMLDMKFIMDNVNGNETLSHDLLCLCSSITTDLRSRYFAISNNECYYGDESPTANVNTSNTCKDWSDQTKDCDGTTKCVGVGNATYVYQNRIDGVWTLWGEWSTCSATCGNQNQIRTRTCTDPAPFGDGSNCAGTATEAKACPVKVACPVWTQWGAWSACSVTCGNQNQIRTRSCTDPATSGGNCVGSGSETKPCPLDDCPAWTQWGGWSACSVTCGNQNQVRTRTCTDPATSGDGGNCVGSGSEIKACPLSACPVWTQWGGWSACSVTCGNQNQIRTRTCTDPGTTGGNCVGSSSETKACPQTAACPVNGGYSAWKKIAHCSVQCGFGNIKVGRTCTNPEPSGGGKDCSTLGPVTKEMPCYIQKCPVPCDDKKCSYHSVSNKFLRKLKILAILPKCLSESTRMKCPKICKAC